MHPSHFSHANEKTWVKSSAALQPRLAIFSQKILFDVEYINTTYFMEKWRTNSMEEMV